MAERNEFVTLLIWFAMNPGLDAALHVDRSCRWVNPAGGRKNQRGQRPKKHHADDKPSKKGSENGRPKQVFDGGVWRGSHVPE